MSQLVPPVVLKASKKHTGKCQHTICSFYFCSSATLVFLHGLEHARPSLMRLVHGVVGLQAEVAGEAAVVCDRLVRGLNHLLAVL